MEVQLTNGEYFESIKIDSLNSPCKIENDIYLSQYSSNNIWRINLNNCKNKRCIRSQVGLVSMCYDEQEKCFLIVCKDNRSKILKANENMTIFDDINLDGLATSCGTFTIKNICFDKCKNTIIIAINENNNIYIFDKAFKLIHTIYCVDVVNIVDIQACDGKIFLLTNKMIIVYNKWFKKIYACKFSARGCEKGFCIDKIGQCSYLITIINECCGKISICKCKIDLQEDCDCSNNEHHCYDNTHNCNKNLHCCGGNSYCCEDGNHGSCDKCIYKIFDSIALEEAGLAHIINAEGEKIQKAVKICTDTKCLVDVNKSVQETLETVLQVEIILTNKLKAAKNILDGCTKKCN